MKPLLGENLLGENLSIDVTELIDSRLLVQANSGGGKSYAIRQILEQTYGHCQHIVIDPESEFHTLREKFDYVLAGQRKDSDCPATIQSAALLARRLLELQTSAIIDIYELGAQRAEFVKLFLTSLINAPEELWHPVLVVIDEANKYCSEKDPCVSTLAVIDLMALGRKRGFAGCLATQRISKLHKSAAAECNSRLIGRTGLDIDLKRAGDDLGFNKKDYRLLRELTPGTFYAFGPAFKTATPTRVKVGTVSTTHPKAGQRSNVAITPPRDRVKRVLAQLKDLPAEAEAEAKSLREWRDKAGRLETEIQQLKVAAPKSEIKIVEKPILKDAQVKALDTLADKTQGFIDRLTTAKDNLVTLGDSLVHSAAALRIALLSLHNDVLSQKKGGPALRLAAPDALVEANRPAHVEVKAPRAAHGAPPSSGLVHHRDGKAPTKGPAKILSALIQHPNGLRSEQIGVFTAYKATSRREYLRVLKLDGFVVDNNDVFKATPSGIQALPDTETLPLGLDLQRYWLARLPKGERAILQCLLDGYPRAVANDDIETRTGYKPTSRREYLRQLVARQLAVLCDANSATASATLFDWAV